MEPVLLVRSGADVPWGFRLQGGKDQHKPLTVQRVTPGSVASTGLAIGEEILGIGSLDASLMTYTDAMETIKGCGDRLELYTSRFRSAGNADSSHHPPTQSSDERVDEAKDVFRETLQPDGPLVTEQPPVYERNEPRREAEKQLPAAAAVQQVPDAVPNVAGRVNQDKRPWSYVPDIHSLQQQRRRVQKKNYAPQLNDYSGQPKSPQSIYPNGITHKHQQQQPQGEAERNGDISHENIYSGPNIPSRTFQLLQSFTSSDEPGKATEGLARAAQRRQKRREILQNEGSVRGRGEENSQEPVFDENEYLAGKIPILGGRQSSRPYLAPSSSYLNTKPSDETDKNDEKPFDERAYLAGRIPLVRGGPIDPANFTLPDSVNSSVKPKEEGQDENEKPFDERAYLAGKIPLVKGGPIDPTQFNLPEKRVVKRYKDVNRPRPRKEFDERAYLDGKLNLLGQTSNRPPKAPVQRAEEKPSWCKKDEDILSEEEYDEDSFLKGRIPIVRRSVDRELPCREKAVDRLKYERQRASWERADNDDDALSDRGGTCSEPEFDERAYLTGRWRRLIASEQEYSTDTECDFPSKTFRILRRSLSNASSSEEVTDSRQSSRKTFSEDEGGLSSDQEKPYNWYSYQGRKIPSKHFSLLKQTMDRKAAAEDKKKSLPKDPIERLKEKSLETAGFDMEPAGIDVDTAIETLEIGKHDPDTYMEMLKKSVEQSNIRIEAENEVTDF